MEKIEGGTIPYIDVCSIYAWATVVSNDMTFGSIEARIIFSIAYNQCIAQM